MKWDPALLPVIGITLISLLSFLCVLALTWPTPKDMVRAFIDVFRAKPPRPAPPKKRMPPIERPEIVRTYEGVIFALVLSSAQKHRTESELANAADDVPDRRHLERERERALDAFVGIKKLAAEFLGKLSDQQIGDIARFLSQSPEYFDGLVTVEESLAFMRDERETAQERPFMAAEHVVRMTVSLGRFYKERQEAEEKAAPPAEPPQA